MKKTRLLSYLAFIITLISFKPSFAQTTITIGTGTSSSSNKGGPIQRSDTSSTTLYSRYIHTYTAAELSAAGMPSGASILSLNWDLKSTNVIIGTGDANMKIYLKNSSATAAIADSWTNLTTGSTLVLDTNFNSTNNFPGTNGWMPFNLDNSFTYTGGAIEIAVEWDCSNISTPAFSGNGAINWRYTSTAPDNFVVKKGGSSSYPSNITDLKTDRTNIQFVFNAIACDIPTSLNATPTSATSVDIGWASSTNALSYNWKIVASGAGSAAMAVSSGTSASTSASASGLSALTSYDFYVEADCGGFTSGFAGPYSFMTLPAASTTVSIGSGTSSSSTRGPIQRADTASSSVYSRFNLLYTATELSAQGITNGAVISSINWDLKAGSNVIIGNGDANFKVYIRNTSNTATAAGTWASMIAGSSLVVDNNYNSSYNFPGVDGWMPFYFNEPFTYTGGSIELAIDWDCSAVSTPAFSGDGALKWRWETTPFVSLASRASSTQQTNLTATKTERVNTQFVYVGCELPSSFNATPTSSTSVNLAWSGNESSYNWKVVALGAGSAATALASGSTSTNSATASGLSPLSSYDLYVEANCGAIGTSGFVGPYSFMTLPSTSSIATLGSGTSSSSTRGPIQRADTASSSVYSRFNLLYTATELSAQGITNGAVISSINWDLKAGSNVIIGNGDANFKVYIRNTSNTATAAGTWASMIAGSSLVVDNNYNSSYNFPGVDGWMPFYFNEPFTYTGGSIELAIDWDCSAVSTPAFSGDGALKWRWETTPFVSLASRASSTQQTNLTATKTERVNTQFVYSSQEKTATFSGTHSNCSPYYDAVSGTGTENHYDIAEFTVPTSGNYKIGAEWTSVSGSDDGYLYLYDTSFDPLNPANNLLYSNDNFGGTDSSQIDVASLIAGTTYYIVGASNISGELQAATYEIVGPDSAEVVTGASTAINGSAQFQLDNSNSILSRNCDEGSWTNYGSGANFGFAIEWDPSNTGANSAAKTQANLGNAIEIGVETSPFGSINTTRQDGAFGMSRWWNVDLNGVVLDDIVNIRFYYDPAELTALEAHRDAERIAAGWNISNVPNVNNQWFKSVGADFSPSLLNDGNNFSAFNAIELIPSSMGMINGVAYVQFDGISSFSGGTLGSGFAANSSVALPVELISFEANFLNNQVSLDWITATEINNAGFEIERSIDGKHFEKIAFVEGNGNSNELKTYKLIDNNIQNSFIYYYRLKQLDYNGEYEYSSISIVKTLGNKDNENAIDVYPNPTTGIINIDNIEHVKSIKIFDLRGRVTIANISNNNQIDFTKFNSGIYFLEIIGLYKTQIIKVNKQ